MRGRWRGACGKFQELKWKTRRPISCSSTAAPPAFTSSTLVAELETRGILVSQFGERIRACTHLDVTAAMIEETIAAIRTVVSR